MKRHVYEIGITNWDKYLCYAIRNTKKEAVEFANTLKLERQKRDHGIVIMRYSTDGHGNPTIINI